MRATTNHDGTVSVEILASETLGGVEGPNNFTINPAPGLLVYDDLVARGIAIEPAVPFSISDRQFAQALAMGGVIPEDEALAWAARGELPAAMQTAVGNLPEDQRFAARMLLSSATNYERDHPLVGLFGSLLGYSAADLDDLWRLGATL